MSFHRLLIKKGVSDTDVESSVSMLGKDFSRRQFKMFFLFFHTKLALTFHANCLLRRQYEWNAIAIFLEHQNIINLSYAEFAKSVGKVKV